MPRGIAGRPECSESNCKNPHKAHGLCATHYLKRKEAESARARCSVASGGERCKRAAVTRGYCALHYRRLLTWGDPEPVGSLRTKSNKRKQNGYIMMLVDGKWQRQHRIVMEELLGRALRNFENVHHRNGLRDDNSPENLELWIKPQPNGQRPEDLVEWVVENYPELVRAVLDEKSQLRLVT